MFNNFEVLNFTSYFDVLYFHRIHANNIPFNAYEIKEYQKNSKKWFRLNIIAHQKRQITCSAFLIGQINEIIQFLLSAAVIDF